MLRYLPIIFACLLLAAHHSRADETGLVILWLTAPLLLFVRRSWVRTIFPFLLGLGALEWGITTWTLANHRLAQGESFLRLVLILGAVTVFTALSGFVFRTPRLRDRFRSDGGSPWPATVAFALTLFLLTMVQVKMVEPTGILLERFLPAGGWLVAFWLAIYAGWLADTFQNPKLAKRWRPRVWSLFSLVFFLQLGLGLAGLDRFLMTGKLHLPVPALIVAGPLFRGEGFFMLILFGASLLLVGPAWCSWLCYIGAWDDIAARRRRRPVALPWWRRHLRVAILILVLVTAYGLGRAGVSPLMAGFLALAFGLIGVGWMVVWSRRTGVMTHCTAYCPIGFLATRVGKLSPFRIRIDEGCDDCGACGKVCRYDALSTNDIQQRRPGEACTLCGDCLTMCQGRNIDYHLLGLTPAAARLAFMVLVASLHAAFLGVARM